MTQEEPESPAVVTPLHKLRPIFDEHANEIIGKKGYKRLDRLEWLHTHKAIGKHQYLAGRRLQRDWQASKIENCPAASMVRTGGNGLNSVADAKLDAGQRLKDALAILPPELVTLTCLFLLPDDHPFSLERIAAKVAEDKRAISFAIRLALSLLARHYGYSTT